MLVGKIAQGPLCLCQCLHNGGGGGEGGGFLFCGLFGSVLYVHTYPFWVSLR